MIFAELEKAAQQSAEREAVITPTERWTYGQLHDEARRLARAGHELSGGDVPQRIAALAAADSLGAGVELRRTDLQVHPRVDVDMERIEASVPLPHEVVLLTSGTSGPPKRAVHTWRSLAAAVHRQDERYLSRRWLLAYDAQSFAGLQVILQSLLTGGTLVLPDRTVPQRTVDGLLRERVEMASATPTFWRGLLCGVEDGALRNSSLTQITLGGEIADQPLLDALREAIPKARISHVYASTEMGVCFAVHDGRAGFPAAWLDDESRTCALRLGDDGELLVRSPRKALAIGAQPPSHPLALSPPHPHTARAVGPRLGGADAWFPTGDLVRIDGERARFAGRKCDTIHVGGNKVQPVDVEAVIRACGAVREVRVYGVESSLAGQLVAADVWATDVADEDEVRQEILAHCRRQLPKYMIPAVLTFAPSAPSQTDKLSRLRHTDDSGSLRSPGLSVANKHRKLKTEY